MNVDKVTDLFSAISHKGVTYEQFYRPIFVVQLPDEISQ